MFSDNNAEPAASLVRRVENTSDETSPWEGISFTQPVGSDKLSDELKRAYPGGSNLRQRKHMAAIAFLRHELMQMQKANPTTKVVESEYPATPEESNLSNDNFDGHSRQSSVSVSHSSFQKAQAWPGVSPNLMQSPAPTSSSAHSSRQIVFSVSDGHTLQPTTRRTMTKEEKLAYRKTRKRGACSTCRRQKGKCTHTGGLLAGSRVSEETIKFQKRQSIDVHLAREIPNQMRNSPRPVHDTEHVLSPQYQPTELHSLRQPEQVPVDVQWDQATHQDAQSDAARYVLSANVNTYGDSTPCQSNANWQSFPGAANTQPQFTPNYGQNTARDEPRTQFSVEPVLHTSPMDIGFHSPFTDFVHESWILPQDTCGEELKPD